MVYSGYIFDLDDTLYCEHDYVKSGFWVVANELANYRSDMDISGIYQMLIAEWKRNGRGRVFDEVCRQLNIDIDVSHLVRLYRRHTPNISLYDDAQKLIFYLKEKGKS